MPYDAPMHGTTYRTPPLVDVALAVALAVSACLAGRYYHPAPWPEFDARAYVLSVATALPLAARRLYPLGALAACCGGLCTYLACGYQPSLNYWVPVLALISLAGRRPSRATVIPALLVAGAIAYSGIAAVLHPVVTVVQSLITPAAALAIGFAHRRVAAQNAELLRLTTLLARYEKEEARRAVTDERLRIARELHDAISQHMTAVTVQSGLAEFVFTSDPQTARAALKATAGAGREAMEELRRLLTVLRVADSGDGTTCDDDTSFATIGRIPEMAERITAAGLPVGVHLEGQIRPLNGGLELCVYRVVQEALTNALKHSGAADAQVTVTYGATELHVLVEDDGRGPGAISGPGSGLGLIGMAERAKIWSGSLTTGHRPGGGYAVRLVLPIPRGRPPWAAPQP